MSFVVCRQPRHNPASAIISAAHVLVEPSSTQRSLSLWLYRSGPGVSLRMAAPQPPSALSSARPLPPPVPPFITRLLASHPAPPSHHHHAYSPPPTSQLNHPHTISHSSSTNSFSPNTSPLLLARSPPLAGSSSAPAYGPQPQMPPQPLYLPPPVMEEQVPELVGPENFSMVSLSGRAWGREERTR